MVSLGQDHRCKKIQPLDERTLGLGTEPTVPKRRITSREAETFGQRLARLRKAAGFSQRDLAAEIDISQRMVAYYERQADNPPAHVLPQISKALRVSADELLGLKASVKASKPTDTRLWRRFKQVEKLPPQDRRQVAQFIDALLDRSRLRQKLSA